MIQPTSRKTTIYLDPDLHRSLRKIGLEAGHSISSFVNEAVRLAFEKSDCDIEAFETREDERDCSFEDVVADLERLGKI
jgi:hypothetical protein